MGTTKDNNCESIKVKATNKNTILNFFETIACIMIVFIHSEFPGIFGSVIVKGMACFGVPLFFLVSGFFLMNQNTTKEELKLKLKKRIKKTLLLNIPMINIPTWFLLAQLYSYIIIYIFANAFLNYKWLPYALASLIIFWLSFRLVVEINHLFLFGNDLSSSILYMNWFVNGLPLISLGIVLKRNETLINKMSTKLVSINYFISFVLMVLEAYLLYMFFNIDTRIFFFNIVNAVMIICLSIKKPNWLSKSNFLNQEGNFKMYVYILHPAVIIVLITIMNNLDWTKNIFVVSITPIIVLLITLLLSITINHIMIKLKSKCN